MHDRVRLLVLACGVLLVAPITSTAIAQCDGRYGDGGYVRYGGGYRTYTSPSRLYRHRSGYLYGYDRAYSSRPYGGGALYPVAYPAAAGAGCSQYANNPRADFDCRRDRLLDAATRVPVDYPLVIIGDPNPGTSSVGWEFLVQGEPVKALGRFTAQLMRSRNDARIWIGHALSASALDDDRTAAGSMRQAVQISPETVAAFEADESVMTLVRAALDRTLDRRPDRGPDPERAFLTASLHYLLGEYEEAADLLVLVAVRDRGAEPLGLLVADALAAEPVETERVATDATADDIPPVTAVPPADTLAQKGS